MSTANATCSWYCDLSSALLAHQRRLTPAMSTLTQRILGRSGFTSVYPAHELVLFPFSFCFSFDKGSRCWGGRCDWVVCQWDPGPYFSTCSFAHSSGRTEEEWHLTVPSFPQTLGSVAPACSSLFMVYLLLLLRCYYKGSRCREHVAGEDPSLEAT